jgi:hypothetical protein
MRGVVTTTTRIAHPRLASATLPNPVTVSQRAPAMSDDEVMVFIFSLAAGFVGAVTLSPSRLHPFHTQANPGIGLHRLVVLLALLALLPSHHVLAALLRYASWLHDERRHGNTPAPVAWLCDADRLGRHPGKPGQFDNRYYLEDTLMPGPAYLHQRGITRLVHLGIENTDVRPDLADHLFQYAQKGFEVVQTSLTGGTEWAPLAPLVLAPRRFLAAGYLLAAGGGFGATVPHPSSGG